MNDRIFWYPPSFFIVIYMVIYDSRNYRRLSVNFVRGCNSMQNHLDSLVLWYFICWYRIFMQPSIVLLLILCGPYYLLVLLVRWKYLVNTVISIYTSFAIFWDDWAWIFCTVLVVSVSNLVIIYLLVWCGWYDLVCLVTIQDFL